MFCDGYCLGISALCFGFISPEICELTLTYTFLQAAHKKNSRHVNFTSHSDFIFLLSAIFFEINTSPIWKIALSLKNYRERYTQLECCYSFTIFAFFADSVMYTNLRFWCPVGRCTWQATSCKNVQTPYVQCQNYTLLRISGDTYRIISIYLHTHTHTLCN